MGSSSIAGPRHRCSITSRPASANENDHGSSPRRGSATSRGEPAVGGEPLHTNLDAIGVHDAGLRGDDELLSLNLQQSPSLKKKARQRVSAAGLFSMHQPRGFRSDQ